MTTSDLLRRRASDQCESRKSSRQAWDCGYCHMEGRMRNGGRKCGKWESLLYGLVRFKFAYADAQIIII